MNEEKVVVFFPVNNAFGIVTIIDNWLGLLYIFSVK